MRYSTILIFLMALIFALSLSIVWLGCDEGGDDDDDDGGGDGGDDDDDTPDIGDPGKISGCVHDFQTGQPVQGATVQVLDNETGAPYEGQSAESPSGDGCVSFEGFDTNSDFVGIKVTRSDYKDTYQFYFANGSENEEFLLVSENTASLVALSLGVTLDPEKAFAAGAVYWGSQTNENPLGCARVTFDPPNPGNIHYFGTDKLPTPLRDIVGDAPSNGEGTNPCCGKENPFAYYVSMNQDIGTGSVTMTATVFDEEDDEGGAGEYSESVVLPQMYADSVSISNIYFTEADYPTDPTPDWCTE